MDTEQRASFLRWIAVGYGESKGASPGVWLCDDQFCLIGYDKPDHE